MWNMYGVHGDVGRLDDGTANDGILKIGDRHTEETGNVDGKGASKDECDVGAAVSDGGSHAGETESDKKDEDEDNGNEDRSLMKFAIGLGLSTAEWMGEMEDKEEDEDESEREDEDESEREDEG